MFNLPSLSLCVLTFSVCVALFSTAIFCNSLCVCLYHFLLILTFLYFNFIFKYHFFLNVLFLCIITLIARIQQSIMLASSLSISFLTVYFIKIYINLPSFSFLLLINNTIFCNQKSCQSL